MFNAIHRSSIPASPSAEGFLCSILGAECQIAASQECLPVELLNAKECRYNKALACKCRGIWSIGAVGRCLSRQLAESKPLTLNCRSLVLVAAPRVSVLKHRWFSRERQQGGRCSKHDMSSVKVLPIVAKTQLPVLAQRAVVSMNIRKGAPVPSESRRISRG